MLVQCIKNAFAFEYKLDLNQLLDRTFEKTTGSMYINVPDTVSKIPTKDNHIIVVSGYPGAGK